MLYQLNFKTHQSFLVKIFQLINFEANFILSSGIIAVWKIFKIHKGETWIVNTNLREVWA